jgi:uncharacterized SAM-binding protein YcdF (DUF218 family)
MGSLRSIRPRLWSRLGLGLAAGLCLWFGGFLYFVGQVPVEVEDPVGKTDAIVVLTGGAERLDTGLELLIAGQAKKLLISGVDPVTTLAALQKRSRIDPAKFACCVEIGHQAADTVGNADEAARWARSAGYRSLRLVTAGYHMPRSLLLFRTAMAEIEVIANPIFPGHVKTSEWWRYPGTARLLAVEFNKYLVSLIRVRLGG